MNDLHRTDLFFLRALLDSLNDGVISLDGRSRIVEWNRGAEHIFGYLRDEVLGKTLVRLIGGPRSREVARVVRNVREHNRTYVNMEAVRFRRDGSPVNVSISVSPIVVEGKNIGSVAIYRDITDRKLRDEEHKSAEKKVRALHAFNQTIVRSLAEGMILENTKGLITFVNPTIEKLLGYDAGELVGQHWKTVVHPDEVNAIQAKTSSRTRTTLEQYETRFADKSGRPVPVLVHARSLFERGRFKGVLSAVTDISALKTIEAELKASQEEALAASRAKGEFLANMSHEIRTPMNGIIGMLELALGTPLTTEQKDFLLSARSSAESLLTILNDILDFSKIEARMIEFDPILFLLRDSLTDIVSALALGAHKKGLEIACHIAPEIPDGVVGDLGRLRQVLINLLGNAIKFTEKGEVVVEVTCASRSDRDILLHFAVKDTGIGIPADKCNLIFNAFVQGDGSTTRKYGGTGLGLAISSQIVAMMGGKIWVESEVGRGSEFHFTIRLGLKDKPDGRPIPVEPRAVENLRVLVVDDNATNRAILKELLTGWSMRPDSAENAPTALALLEACKRAGEPFKLILVDSCMPGMDGFTLIEHIKKDPEFSGATILMLTSAEQLGDLKKSRDLGVSAYLTKPIKPSALFDAIMIAMGAAALDQSERPVITAQHIQRLRRRYRILIAEDNPINQKVAVRLLEKAGHRVATAGDGRAALDALRTETYDLVLMDVQMPNMDGFVATAAVRKDEKTRRSRLPIIAMTAHAMTGDREKCLEAGMDAYIAKPLRPAELFETIDRIMAERRPTVLRRVG